MTTDGATSSVMDFEIAKPECTPISEKMQIFLNSNPEFSLIMDSLASNESIFYKNQQRDEADLSKEQKLNYLCTTFEKNKSNFLAHFGQFLNHEQVDLFRRFANESEDGYEVLFHLNKISRMHSTQRRHKCLRNRRYAALKRLISNDSYFSEIEMMKRNPLLYEQLIGQYLSSQEKKARDYQSGEKTFVGVLMDGIEKEQTEIKKQQQVEAEDDVSENDSSSSDSEDDEALKPSEQKPIKILWGEMTSNVPKRTTKITKHENLAITSQERSLLREEFVSSMYQSFLDGNDDDFDYNDVDNNDEYDNLEIVSHDEEEKYFDSEEPEDVVDDGAVKVKEDSSEDELDIYMSALNQHPAVSHLSENFKKL